MYKVVNCFHPLLYLDILDAAYVIAHDFDRTYKKNVDQYHVLICTPSCHVRIMDVGYTNLVIVVSNSYSPHVDPPING